MSKISRMARRAPLVAILPLLVLALIGTPAAAVDNAPPFENVTIVAFNADGTEAHAWVDDLSLFGHVIYVRRQWAGGPFGDPVDLGFINAIGSPAMALNCAGQLHVFVVGTDNHLWVKYQTTPVGSFTTSWHDMGGFLTSNPDAYENGQGRIEIFARGGNHALYTRWQNSPCGSWSNWTSLGGSITDYPTIAQWSDSTGHIRITASGTDARNWVKTRLTFTSPWSQWEPI